jgi:PPK2 family polyphosphate:nucleotide phosphotransferase
MSIDLTPFRVASDDAIDLAARPTRIPDLYESKGHYRDRLGRRVDRMRDLQGRLYADDRYALLLVFQAMDAAGKDGAIKHVLSGVNPQGVEVHSFKQPSPEELDHDFLWRTAVRLPRRGHIGIFNRSYYEEVLVVRVHPKYLDGQRLPDRPADLADLWRGRYRSIVEHEAHLHRNGTRIVKFFLHLSLDEQRERFVARLEDRRKNWKVSAGDAREREHWDAYQRAYADAISATSTSDCPWYIVPADDKKSARLIVSEVICELLERLALRYPTIDDAELREYRRLLGA